MMLKVERTGKGGEFIDCKCRMFGCINNQPLLTIASEVVMPHIQKHGTTHLYTSGTIERARKAVSPLTLTHSG